MPRPSPSAKSPAGNAGLPSGHSPLPLAAGDNTRPAGPMVHLAYNRAKAQYQVDVHFPHDPTARKRCLLGTSDPNAAQTAYEAFQRDILPGLIATHKLRHTTPSDLHNPTATEFIDAWTRWARAHRQPGTVTGALYAWKHLTDLTGIVRIAQLQRRHIELFKAERLRKGASKQTVNNNLKDLDAIFNRANREGFYLGPNPIAGVERYRIPAPQPTFHTRKQREALLQAAQAHSRQLSWLVLLCAWQGLRKLEAVNARWEWFNWSTKGPTLTITPGPSFTIKDHDARTLPLAARVRDALHPHRQPNGYLFTSNCFSGPSQGKSRYRWDPKKILIAALHAGGLPKDDPFQRLRETFASLHVQDGTDIYTVSKWLGHSSVRTTERHYAALKTYDPNINNTDPKPTPKRKRPPVATEPRKV